MQSVPTRSTLYRRVRLMVMIYIEGTDLDTVFGIWMSKIIQFLEKSFKIYEILWKQLKFW